VVRCREAQRRHLTCECLALEIGYQLEHCMPEELERATSLGAMTSQENLSEAPVMCVVDVEVILFHCWRLTLTRRRLQTVRIVHRSSRSSSAADDDVYTSRVYLSVHLPSAPSFQRAIKHFSIPPSVCLYRLLSRLVVQSLTAPC